MKRLLAIIVAFAMVIGVMPAVSLTASAEDTTPTVTSVVLSGDGVTYDEEYRLYIISPDTTEDLTLTISGTNFASMKADCYLKYMVSGSVQTTEAGGWSIDTVNNTATCTVEASVYTGYENRGFEFTFSVSGNRTGVGYWAICADENPYEGYEEVTVPSDAVEFTDSNATANENSDGESGAYTSANGWSGADWNYSSKKYAYFTSELNKGDIVYYEASDLVSEIGVCNEKAYTFYRVDNDGLPVVKKGKFEVEKDGEYVFYADKNVNVKAYVDSAPAITHEPTQSEPYVEVNFPEGATYQWYSVERTGTEAVENDGVILDAYEGAYYEEGAGWHGASDGTCLNYALVYLYEGQAIKVVPESYCYDFHIWDYDNYNYGINGELQAGEALTYIAEYEGWYDIYTFFSSSEDIAVRIYVLKPTYTALEGQTAATLSTTDAGNYICTVTFADGTTDTSKELSIEPVYNVYASASPYGTGTVTANPNKGVAGTIVTLSATPNEGYVFKEWKVMYDGAETITVENNQFTLGEDDVVINAVFEEENPRVPKITDVKIYINDSEQAEKKGEVVFTDGDTLKIVYEGENFDMFPSSWQDSNWKIRLFNRTATLAQTNNSLKNLDTTGETHTFYYTYNAEDVKDLSLLSVGYTNSGESETIAYTLRYDENPDEEDAVAKITGVEVQLNGVLQSEGKINFTDGDEITVIYKGENFDKLTSDYKYTIGSRGGNIVSATGVTFFTIDTTSAVHTATKTYAATAIGHDTLTAIGYTNAGEEAYVSGYILNYQKPYTVTLDGVVTETDGYIVLGTDNGDETYSLPADVVGYYIGDELVDAGKYAVSEGEVITTVNFNVTMVNGAQVRYGGGLDENGKISQGNGLRFLATVDRSNFDADAYGMKITAEGSTAETIVNAEKWQDDVTFSVALTNMAESNYIRKFTATPYVKVKYDDGTEKTVYGTGTVTRSIYQVAAGLLKDETQTAYGLSDVLNAYANQTGIRLVVKDGELKANTSYTAKGAYNLTEDELHFAVSDAAYDSASNSYSVILTAVGNAEIITDNDYWYDYIRINNNNSLIKDKVTVERVEGNSKAVKVTFAADGLIERPADSNDNTTPDDNDDGFDGESGGI